MPDKPPDDELVIPTAWLSVAATLVLMLVPPAALLYASPSVWWYFCLGAGSWAAAVALKFLIINIPAVRPAVASGPHGAALWGFLSAVSELGFTAIAIAGYVGEATIFEVVALGVGVASAEILYVLGAAVREHLRGQDPELVRMWIIGARQSAWVRNMLFIERLSAMLGHVGSRGLIYWAIANRQAWVAVIAVLAFAVVDGITVYGRAQKWNWCEPRIARSFYSMALLTGAVECALFAALAAYPAIAR